MWCYYIYKKNFDIEPSTKINRISTVQCFFELFTFSPHTGHDDDVID